MKGGFYPQLSSLSWNKVISDFCPFHHRVRRGTKSMDHACNQASLGCGLPSLPPSLCSRPMASGLCSEQAKPIPPQGSCTCSPAWRPFSWIPAHLGLRDSFLHPPPPALSPAVSCFSFIKRFVTTLQDITCLLCLLSRN